ncbi:uncharacterized protein LOC134717925 [Mytilus trossulus]|uniref:uncharacterized protein LOC134717925 n=1 Tax=Mytilus trossulus TaxID=6551 RepID=UPI0030071265
MIPGLTSYRYYAAKKHISEVGCGLPIQEMKQMREKIDPCQLEPFLDFITSSHIIKDLPFGERKLKLSTGDIICTPNVIRAIAPTSIIRQYKQFCEDEEIKPLGTSTMYKILEECAASVRHSVEGLDYYVAEGGRAFRDIEEVLEGFECEDENIKKMKADLLEVKRYLKSDYKVHVRDMAQIADHCRSYALGDIDSNFRNECSHEHTLCYDMTEEEEVEECEPPAKKAKSEGNIYSCPIEGCDRSFKNNSGLEQHILLGNCN